MEFVTQKILFFINYFTFIRGVSAIFLVFFEYLAAQAGSMVNKNSVKPGSKIAMKGTPLSLMGTPIIVGKPLPPSVLTTEKDYEAYMGTNKAIFFIS